MLARLLRATALLGLLACASPSPAAPAPGAAPAAASGADALYGQARQEGRAVVYIQSPETLAPVKAGFEKRYPGVTIELVGGRGTEQLTRLNAEYVSGQHVADVVGSGGSTMLELVQAGYLAPVRPADADKLIPEAEMDEGRHWIYALNVYGVLVNTRLTPPDKLPTQRADLLDPFWRGEGKLLLDDPRAQGGGQSFLVVSYRDLGPDFLQRLAAQKPTWTRDRLNGPVQVARGEFALFAPQNVAEDVARLEKSAPVKLVFLRDGSYYTELTMGVLTEAPHPNAARLWMDYLYGEEGQRAMAQEGLQYGARPDVPAPAGYPKLSELTLTTRSREERLRNDDYMKTFNETLFR